MIDWIKFSERAPEKEGWYLCYDGDRFHVLEWNGKKFYRPSRWLYQGPDFWAEINPPRKEDDFSWNPGLEEYVALKPIKEPPMPEVKLCKDCRFIKGDCSGRQDHGHALCGNPKARRSPVDGQPIHPCDDMRNDGTRGLTILQQGKRP
jgi:hypothetical protein